MPREALSDQQLAWVDEWISRRGGGLAMVGGPHSFAAGRWADTPIGAMLPVELLPGAEGLGTSGPISIEPITAGTLHSIWHIAADDAENRTLLKGLPPFLGRNSLGRVKSGADLLAVSPARRGPGAGDRHPALRPGPHAGDEHRNQPPIRE